RPTKKRPSPAAPLMADVTSNASPPGCAAGLLGSDTSVTQEIGTRTSTTGKPPIIGAPVVLHSISIVALCAGAVVGVGNGVGVPVGAGVEVGAPGTGVGVMVGVGVWVGVEPGGGAFSASSIGSPVK